MQSNEHGGPAFPNGHDVTQGQFAPHGGMTLRQYAAIKLKVPDSGTDWLDAMIEKSLRDDFAAKAMQGLLAEPSLNAEPEEFAWRSYAMADAMLRARKGGAA